MSAQYDAIAADYKRTRESPLRRYVEARSFFSLLGDVCGKNVLDLACGEGFYTRRLKQAGAANVLGVDISAGMITLAEEEEGREALGIRYVCADVAELELGESFDLVTATYLLHYSASEAELGEMCLRIAAHLKPGGRLVCINENPMQTANDYKGYTQYGFNKSVELPRVEGSPISYAMVSGRKMIRFNAYFYSREAYETALRAAGFSDIQWHGLQLDPAGAQECGAEYFREYLENPPIAILECRL
ncbi:MAG: class I SAM-dependent methyltransferase [Gammaproteobacteria bacterium]|jgi:ubiquinone/menaquinone biosynthesis C-methylase UbiE|nr:class I SAM-dependent methyltransferase [Gammaproteobacteria bacterium]MDP6617723.1 class I SAM-dependent methyltransferase [Gammaproteobacteria bacterium]MDP6694109.1 class I SAM-dependent methyltransferase [Gammaproteobacteria bacterium]MDP7041849.1 class I SAM-dependent methyltransferase [Gammaproteobacteria bacterium]